MDFSFENPDHSTFNETVTLDGESMSALPVWKITMPEEYIVHPYILSNGQSNNPSTQPNPIPLSCEATPAFTSSCTNIDYYWLLINAGDDPQTGNVVWYSYGQNTVIDEYFYYNVVPGSYEVVIYLDNACTGEERYSFRVPLEVFPADW